MKLEKFISTILHPVFIPTITIFIVIKEYSNVIILENQAGLVLLGAFIFTLLLPLVSVLLLLLSKKIKSVEMPLKEERILPIILTAISMITGFFYLKEIFGVRSNNKINISWRFVYSITIIDNYKIMENQPSYASCRRGNRCFSNFRDAFWAKPTLFNVFYISCRSSRFCKVFIKSS